MLVHDEIEFVALSFRFPLIGKFAVVLDFYDVLFQYKTGFEESLHDVEGEGHEVFSFACVTNEYGTEFIGL